MNLYFFHLRNGEDVLLDGEGRQLPGLLAVAAAALYEARSILSADVLDGTIDLEQRIEVVDEAGATVHTLQFREALTIR